MDNRDSLENVSSKWTAEINEHCQGVKIVLVALKCDLREEHDQDEDEEKDATPAPKQQPVTYAEGLEVAKRIGALRYLGMILLYACWLVLQLTGFFPECSAMRNRGVNEAFTEAARVALSVKPAKSKTTSDKCHIM